MNFNRGYQINKAKLAMASIAILLTCISINDAQATTPKSKSVKDPCRLELEFPHISGSLLRATGMPFMKANVSSICNIPQSQTRITVMMYKMGLVDHLVAQNVYQMKKSDGAKLVVDFKDTIARCVTKEPTRYFTKAYSKAFIGGKWMYAGLTKSGVTEPIKCGTKSLNPFS